MPGRHAVQFGHLGDHVGPSSDFFIRCQSERGDLLRSVAGYASLIEDWRDVFRIGERQVRRRFAIPTDQASGRLSFGDGNWLAGQQLVDRTLKVPPLRLGFVIAGRPISWHEPKLVVNASPVADSALAV